MEHIIVFEKSEKNKEKNRCYSNDIGDLYHQGDMRSESPVMNTRGHQIVKDPTKNFLLECLKFYLYAFYVQCDNLMLEK